MNSSSAARRASSTTVARLSEVRDVEEHELVRARPVIAGGQLDGISGVAQINESDALHHPAAVDVETRITRL